MSATVIILAEYREAKARVEIPVVDPLSAWMAWASFWMGRR